MKTKKPFLEVVPIGQDSSLRLHHNLETKACMMMSWHFHPEIELVCIPKGKGRLSIGNKDYEYQNGAMVLLHSNIPHKSFDNGFESEEYEEVVLQILPEQLDKLLVNFNEFQRISQLIKAAQQGVVLPLDKANDFYQTRFYSLLNTSSIQRLLTFIEVLDELSKANYQILGVLSSNNLNPFDAERISRVFDYIATQFMNDISSQSAADLLNLTDSSFCRFFLKHTQKTFKKVLNEYRITHACKLLSNTNKSMEIIAYESGYGTQSFFNRMFKAEMLMTPMVYRRERQGVVVR
jgi:AraC-like DNA-binding protein